VPKDHHLKDLKDLRVIRQKELKVISVIHHRETKVGKVPKDSKEDLDQQDLHSKVMVGIKDPLVLQERRDLREMPIPDQQVIQDLRDRHPQKVLRVIKVPKDSKVTKVLKEPLVL
jgi:hypothetical protein